MRKISIDKLPAGNPEDKDTIRIKGGDFNMSINVLQGKQGEYFLCYAPSLNISGYGKTEKEAEEFIKVEMRTFCEDLMDMNPKERGQYLISLGFKKEKFHNKNFSKAYVDGDGKLQDLDAGTVERKVLTTTAV